MRWRRSSACGKGDCAEIAAAPEEMLIRSSPTRVQQWSFTRAEFGDGDQVDDRVMVSATGLTRQSRKGRTGLRDDDGRDTR
ncbi:DUF397 domain-containing protein [Nocardia terpenica]|uniref:DUF397 domain-containing protein n=1 Tax=Nocardia terpenica TaxID=455432 RepID=UPI0018933EE0|nr:DUF397 domain-containing protein [Nocardia terpenica]MBF6104869.1 DUF397 domain-containing protein [Nocardia terpenica]MBF6112694.1 DUF397 domain-containing protein [Nocardia terpenica]MBF6118597.1 DUF397 domain-containing protein [Nocardia terpenica]MBF6155076.1 DUF397 domain-containing protein [Nocardia terpenica]